MGRRCKRRAPVFIFFVLVLFPLVSKAQRNEAGDDIRVLDWVKRAIDGRRSQGLESADYYQRARYRQVQISLSDVKPEEMNRTLYRKIPSLFDRMAVCPVRKKLIVPVSVRETVSQQYYRKNRASAKTLVRGVRSSEVDALSSVCEEVDSALSGVFSDLVLHDAELRLPGVCVASPLSEKALSFYRYGIVDMVEVGGDSCYCLSFRPSDPQAFGPTGRLYIVADSTCAVRKCEMNLRPTTATGWIRELEIIQTFEPIEDGRWVLKDDDMIAEVYLEERAQEFQARQTTRYDRYAFDRLPSPLFRLKEDVIEEVEAPMRDEAFWRQAGVASPVADEAGVHRLAERLKAIPAGRPVAAVLEALIDNAIETGRNGRFVFAPVKSFAGYNQIEGWRVRVGGYTTARLHRRFFLSGYYAYGFRDEQSKYKGEVAYSFHKKKNFSDEFPRHYVAFSQSYDLMGFSDKFLKTEKDNVFVGFKSGVADQASYVRESSFRYERETYAGFSYSLSLKNRNDRPTGSLAYIRNDPQRTVVRDITTSEARIEWRYAPGELFIQTNKRRVPVSLGAPVFTLAHTVGMDRLLGGDYRFHLTEAGVFKRFGFSSWGLLDIDLRASKQWSKAPFPLLITPETNLSYIIQEGTYNLVNNLEFLGDRYASMALSYNLNGKLFDQLPLLKGLGWQEVVGFRSFVGGLSEKNDPERSGGLFYFPTRNGEPVSFAMPGKPYMEASIGIHKLFKLIDIEYVRRLNYLDHPNVNKHGVRIGAAVVF